MTSPSQWRPIDSAPLGTDLLCYCRQTERAYIAWKDVTGSWWKSKAATAPTRSPTHWQHLPAPPPGEFDWYGGQVDIDAVRELVRLKQRGEPK